MRAARFFDDGSFVVVPGVEPNVYLYDRTGKLVHTWQSAGLGFLDRCDLSQSRRADVRGNRIAFLVRVLLGPPLPGSPEPPRA